MRLRRQGSDQWQAGGRSAATRSQTRDLFGKGELTPVAPLWSALDLDLDISIAGTRVLELIAIVDRLPSSSSSGQSQQPNGGVGVGALPLSKW